MNIRRGATRIVVLVGHWALKVPSWRSWRLFLQGLLANMQEAQFWTMRDPRLCPVLFALPGGFLVGMRRAEPLDGFQWAAFAPVLQDWRYQGNCIVPVEFKPDSFGVLDGRIVAVDYGS